MDNIAAPLWQPSLQDPDRLHARGEPGRALCDAGVEKHPVRCALCSIALAGNPARVPADVRQYLEAECAGRDEQAPGRLAVLSRSNLDDPAAARSAAQVLRPVQVALTDTFLEVESLVRALDVARPSTHGARARAHLFETLVALEASFAGHDLAEAVLRHLPGTV